MDKMLQPKDTMDEWIQKKKNKTHIHTVYKGLSSDLRTHTD